MVGFMDTLSDSIPLVAAVVGIATASFCTTISSVISARGLKKAKQAELIFHEMVAAYYDFLQVCEEFSDPHDPEQLLKFGNCSTRALLFASPHTQDLIGRYGKSVSERLIAKERHSREVMKIAFASGELRGELVKSMQKDLKK